MLRIFQTGFLANQEHQKNLSQNGFIDKILTFEDFKNRAILVENSIAIDNDTRTLLLREAAKFEDFKKLGFSLDFISFLQNSSFIISFLQECSLEKIDLNELKKTDAYAEYEEKIDVLQTLKQRYEKLLKAKNYIDPIFLPQNYRLNTSFIKSFEKIIFYQIDYINNFEFDLLSEISQVRPVFINLKLTKLNKALSKHYSKIGLNLKENFEYLINLSEKRVINQKIFEIKRPKAEIFEASNTLSQISYVKKRVYDFVNEGIDPQKIVIISNNENFFKLLRILDEEKNFDISNSFTFENSDIYKKLSAIYEYLIDKNYENIHRLERFFIDREDVEKSFLSIWEEKIDKQTFMKLFEGIKSENLIENSLYREELSSFLKLFSHLKEYPLNKIFHFFLNRLKNVKLPEEERGKVAVLKPNEAKGGEFEAVIAVDFNDSIIFKNPFNDLFLSSQIRAKSKMLTFREYKDIQKNHYLNLFANAKKVSISFIKDEQNSPTRFLFEIDTVESSLSEESLNEIIFKSSKQKPHFNKEIVQEHDFTKEILSPLKLKTFLDCKRKYYLRYIEKLEDFQIPTDQMDERTIGIFLHEALFKLYEENKEFATEQELLEKLKNTLYSLIKDQPILKLSADIWINKLQNFAKNEIERKKEGFEIKFLEKEIRGKYKDFFFKGKVDRVDEKDGKYYIIDYKSGRINLPSKNSLNKTTDFQLQIYFRLLEKSFDIEELYLYDLENAKLIKDPFFEEKLYLLDEKLKLLQEKTINFSQTEEISKCRYCPYAIICQR